MARKVGAVSVVVLGILSVILVLMVFTHGTARSAEGKADKANERVGDVEIQVTANEVRIEGIRDDLTEIKGTQHSMDEKLDRLIERTP